MAKGERGTVDARRAPDADGWYWQGRAHLQAGSWAQAAQAFSHAIRHAPKQAPFYRARGLALARLDRFGAAIADFQRAVGLAPYMALAYSDLGVTLLKANRAREAVAPLEHALKIDPALGQARVCLGLALAHAGLGDRALDILDSAVADDPDPEIHSARAWAMLGQGRVEESIAALARTLALRPDHAVANYNLLFSLQHRAGITAQDLFAAHRHWATLHAPPALPASPAWSAALPPRVGVVSGDLRRHAVSVLTLRVFEALARQGTKIICFANQSDADDVTARWRRAAHRWHVVDEMDDETLTALIVRERIGILFDLSGLTARHRMPVFAHRAAPLQVSWAGYTGTTGLITMDALVADAREVPPGEDPCYSERVVRMPHCYVTFDPPADAPEPMRAPEPDGRITFGCFQRAPKLNEPLLSLWAGIAQALPQARFLLRYGCYAEQQTQRVVCAMAQRAGLDPARLAFEPGGSVASMLAAYARVDIALDTRPYSGGVTTLEALWMGVPVVTWPGETFAGRHSASHLHAAGCGELIVESGEAYVQAAVSLARNPARLDAYRQDLRDWVRRSPLCDGERFAADLMGALRSMPAPIAAPGSPVSCASGPASARR